MYTHIDNNNNNSTVLDKRLPPNHMSKVLAQRSGQANP